MEPLKLQIMCVIFFISCQESQNQHIEVNHNKIGQTTPEMRKQNRECRYCSPEKVHRYEQPVNIARPQAVLKPLNLRLNPNINPMPRKTISPSNQAIIKTQPIKVPLRILLDNKKVKDNSIKNKAISHTTKKVETKKVVQKEPEHNKPTLSKRTEFFEDDDVETAVKPLAIPKTARQQETEASTTKSAPQTDIINNTHLYSSNVLYKSKSDEIYKPNKHANTTDVKTKLDVIKNNTCAVETSSKEIDKNKHIPNNETLNVTNETTDIPSVAKEKSIPTLIETRIDDKTPKGSIMGDVFKTPDCTETSEMTIAGLVFSKILENEDSGNVKIKSKVDPRPTERAKYESNDSIIIRNHNYEEVFERSPPAAYTRWNQEPYELKSWSYKDDIYPYEFTPYQGNNNGENCVNTSNGKVSYSFTACDDQIDDTMKSRSDGKDRIWRTWKNTEILINASRNDSQSGAIDKGTVNHHNNNVPNGVKTPIMYGLTQPLIGFDGCYKNHDTPVVFPYYLFSNSRYVY